MPSTIRARAMAAAAFALLASACSHDTQSPQPGLQSVMPDLVCNGPSVSSANGATTVALTGQNFTPMPSQTLGDPRQLLLPKVTLDPRDPLPGGTAPSSPVTITDDPADAANSRVHWTSETNMSFDVDPADMLPAGTFDVTVTNPDGSSAATLDQVLAVIPPPVVTAAQPMAICDDQGDQIVEVTGTNFLVYDGAAPTVTLGTPPDVHTYAATVDPANCAAVPGTYAETNVQLCTSLTFTVPKGDIVVTSSTMLDLVVTNPPPADCASSTAFQITIEPPPRVDSVVPATVCEGGSTLTISGANFLPGASVTMDCSGTVVTAGTVDVNGAGTQITAVFGGGAQVGSCEVIVQNPDGCTDEPPHQTVNVTTGPIVFFVDPDVAYNGINTRITIYATTITPGLPPDAVVISQGGTQTQLAYTYPVPGHPNRVQAIVPAGQPTGVYDLTFKDGSGCEADLPQALTVTDTTTVSLAKVDPPFGYTGEDTAVTISRDTTAQPPNDAPFVETPRVFLNPADATSTDVAVELQSVVFLDGDRVTGVVPRGTPPNDYDVILVNPDGTVGYLPYALATGYTETQNPAPEIYSATPSSIVDATGQNVVLGGAHFDPADTVTLSCVDANGNPLPDPPVVSQTPSCGTGCTQSITIDGSGLSSGSVCVVTLTNPDGAFARYSAIGVTNASLNLSPPHVGPAMNVGRRALSVGAGDATNANRYLYAIGGDTGAASGALDSVEYAPVDLYGQIGAFSLTTPALPTPKTLAGAVTIGRYIYLAGGDTGTAAVATAERAMILSPRETPVITDVDLALTDTGLDPGKYHYRVSAVFSNTDPDNPGGESLASDGQTVRIPEFPSKKVTATLVWTAPVDDHGFALPNVAGYRIYRTVNVNDPPGTEVLLGTAGPSTTTFTDDGSMTPSGAGPVAFGSTGTWAPLPDLGTAREGLAVAWARDPAAVDEQGIPTTFYVYALLGSDGSKVLDTYEYLTVTVQANGHQTVSAAWTPGATSSAHARWHLGAWTVDDTVSSVYGSDTWVFIGGGQTFAGTGQTTVEAGLVAPGGQLSIAADTAVSDFGAAVSGYGVCAANDQLFTFGGLNGAPSKGAKSASLIDPPPTLGPGAWNDEGLNMTHGRYLLGSAVRSSFIFLLGGQTDEPSPASTTTELVIW